MVFAQLHAGVSHAIGDRRREARIRHSTLGLTALWSRRKDQARAAPRSVNREEAVSETQEHRSLGGYLL